MDERIKKIIKDTIDTLGLYLYHVEQKGNNISVYIEKDSGVSAEDCQEAYEALILKLNAYLPEVRNLKLEVSSPGIERFLYKKKHYEEAIGKTISVKTDTESYYGILTSISQEAIEIEEKRRGKILIRFKDIQHAQVKFSTENLFGKIK